MEELIKDLKANAGLTHEQALQSIEIMKQFIVAKVPPMFSGFVDGFFAGKSTNSEDILGE